ncbi:DUF6300 family protein [Streptomyces sp. NPDC020681]|uniref:DUF6300 family protein n=1 Tax=Streptomyces sp. NPDC020681 TaxID=3365083 RepID=UPI0037AF5BC2
MTRVELAENLPSCSRCGGPLISSAVMPQEDENGFPIHLELCASCDVGKPAACALLAWFGTGGGYDMARVEEGADLFVEWTKEGMAAHGWVLSADEPSEVADEAAPVPGDEASARVLMSQDIPGTIADVERLQALRDALTAQLDAASPEERARLQDVIRRFGAAAAAGLAAQDTTAADLRDLITQPPDPLNPEAEQRLRDLFGRLVDEQVQDDREADG